MLRPQRFWGARGVFFLFSLFSLSSCWGLFFCFFFVMGSLGSLVQVRAKWPFGLAFWRFVTR